MKIALYTGSALPKLGGQELVVDALARQFLWMGHEPTVLAPRPRRPLRVDDASLPYPVIRHPRFYSTTLGVGWYRVFLRRAMRRHGFDVLHCHDVYPTGYVAALLKDEIGIPIVITSHGGDVKEGNARLVKRGMKGRYDRALGAASALVSIGSFTEAGFQRLYPSAGPIHTIPNGVDLTSFSELAPRPAGMDASIVSGQFLLFIGRLKDRKGVDVLLDALAKLPARCGTELVIAGEGEERSRIESQVDRLGLRGRVRLLGRSVGAEKYWLLQNALAVVMPSRMWEAFPLVVLESYAAGKPVVGSDIPGLRDLIKPDTTGLLFAEGSAEALAAAMKRVIEDSALRQAMGRNAQQLAQSYAWPEIARRHLELYTSLLKPQPEAR